MRPAILAAALTAASPAAAAQSAPAPAAPAAAVPIDPARLALATVTVDHVWPLGTYQRMMSGTFEQMMDSVMASMFDMKLSDVVGSMGVQLPEGERVDPNLARASMRELMMKFDPYFEERMRISNRVMVTELVPVMSRIEPQMRSGLARAYARKFTPEQLQDLNRFFATPTGRFYAAESMLLFADPEVMAMMNAMVPEMMKAMPELVAKVQAATAHLPPPNKLQKKAEEDKPNVGS